VRTRYCRLCGMPSDALIHVGGDPDRCHAFEAKPREWPILFRAPLVRANRQGRKTETRRLSPRLADAKPGDLIVVRETWRADTAWDAHKPSEIAEGAAIWYEADGPGAERPRAGKLRPSIFLPRWASRDVYPILSVRAERLQEITEEGARAEGALFHDGGGVGHSGWRHDPNHGFVYATARDSYFHLWVKINGEPSLRDNPIVWVISYRRAQ
jgi:hypothetical protein